MFRTAQAVYMLDGLNGSEDGWRPGVWGSGWYARYARGKLESEQPWRGPYLDEAAALAALKGAER